MTGSAFSTSAPTQRCRRTWRSTRRLGCPWRSRGVPVASRRARVDALLDAAGLADRRHALPIQLSGGQRQAAALCAALSHRPRLLLADEPTAELDAASAQTVSALIDELAASDGATVIVVSHDDALAEHAQRALRIRDGRVVEDRSGARGSLVVGRGGWIRLPAGLLGQAGINGTAQAEAVDGGLLLTPVQPQPARSAPSVATAGALDAPPAAPLDRAVGSWTAATVELRAVSCGRGRGAARAGVLERLSISFEPGTLTAVTGRSGIGKTTLLELIACLRRPDSGEVVLDGRPLDRLDHEQLAALRRERIGYLPQEPVPIGFLTAVENVTLALALRDGPGGAATERAEAALALVSLADRARQRVQRLSAGEAQRVALARALACARGLLVVDEPTSRLDQDNATTVAIALCEAAADGQTVICATHDPDLIRYANRVVELGT